MFDLSRALDLIPIALKLRRLITQKTLRANILFVVSASVSYRENEKIRKK